jgi:hypothetical protein
VQGQTNYLVLVLPFAGVLASIHAICSPCGDGTRGRHRQSHGPQRLPWPIAAMGAALMENRSMCHGDICMSPRFASAR